jgi:cytochrome c556
MRMGKEGLVLMAAVAGGFAGMSTSIRAADAAHDRHEAMEGVGSAMKALGAIAKKEVPFDASVVSKHALTIADNLKTASTLFPAGSGGGESRAKPEIWTETADFDKIMKDGRAAALALQSVKDEAAFGPALQALSANCKSCHDRFRLPKK